MDSTLKNILTGAVLQLGVKAVDQLAFYANGSKTVPGWYDSVPGVGPIAPSIDDWVLDLGLPAAMYFGGKLMNKKKPKLAVKLREMGIGAGLSGLGTFTHDLINRVGPTLNQQSAGLTMAATQQLSPTLRYSIAPAKKGRYS